MSACVIDRIRLNLEMTGLLLEEAGSAGRYTGPVLQGHRHINANLIDGSLAQPECCKGVATFFSGCQYITFDLENA